MANNPVFPMVNYAAAGMTWPQMEQQKNIYLEVINQTLFNKDKVLMISNFSADEKKLALALLELADIMNISALKTFVETYAALTISDNRLGRKETINAIMGLSGKRNIGDKLKDLFSNEGA